MGKLQGRVLGALPRSSMLMTIEKTLPSFVPAPLNAICISVSNKDPVNDRLTRSHIRSPVELAALRHGRRFVVHCSQKGVVQLPRKSYRSRYRESYPLPQGVMTKLQTFTDTRGRTWSYESDSISMYGDESMPPTHIVLCLQNFASLGVTRTYWDRMFDFVVVKQEDC